MLSLGILDLVMQLILWAYLRAAAIYCGVKFK